MPQQASGLFGRAPLRQGADATPDADPGGAPDTDFNPRDDRVVQARAEREVQRFVDSGELQGPGGALTATEAAIARARQLWKEEEEQRLTDAEASWNAKSEKRAAVARVSVQRAELALQGVRRELAETQALLERRNAELAEARAAHIQDRERWSQSPQAAQAEKAARDIAFQRRVKIVLKLTLNAAVTVLIAALAILASQRAAPVVTNVWQHETGPNSEIRPLLVKAGLPDTAATHRAPATLIDVSAAKLRARPSVGAAVVATLSRNTEVISIRSRGKWTFVQTGEGKNERQGWVASSALKNPDIGSAHE